MMYIRPLLLFRLSLNMKKPHQILGVNSAATNIEIKQAYYRLAKIYHPDLNSSANSTKFTEINNAYQQLLNNTTMNKEESKDTKRKQHSDQNKYSKSKKQNPFEQARNDNSEKFWGADPNYGYHDQEQDLFEDDTDVNQQQLRGLEKAFSSFVRNGYLKKKYRKYQYLINQLFNNQKGNNVDVEYFYFTNPQNIKSKAKKSGKPKNKSANKKLDISIKLMVERSQLNTQKLIEFQRQVTCHKCAFDRQKNYKKIPCNKCDKSGLDDKMNRCKKCQGKGFNVKYDCKSCQNVGMTKKKIQEVISIPQSIKSGEKIIIKGRGHHASAVGGYGDLIIDLFIVGESHQNPNKQSGLHPNQIFINIFEAVLGVDTQIKTNTGNKRIKIPPGVQDGQMIACLNLHKNKNYKSKIYNKQQEIKVNIIIPDIISDKQRVIYEKLRDIRNNKVQNNR